MFIIKNFGHKTYIGTFQSLLKSVFTLIEDLLVISVYRLYTGACDTFHHIRSFSTASKQNSKSVTVQCISKSETWSHSATFSYTKLLYTPCNIHVSHFSIHAFVYHVLAEPCAIGTHLTEAFM